MRVSNYVLGNLHSDTIARLSQRAGVVCLSMLQKYSAVILDENNLLSKVIRHQVLFLAGY
jgi:hypothetical protein